MILEYHRPKTIEAALGLLSRTEPVTVPLGGGTVLNRPSPEPLAVVDLQALNLDSLERSGRSLRIGATLTLQALLDSPDLPSALSQAIRHEATYNLRQVATVAGSLVAAHGRSPFATTLLALDARLTLLPGDEQTGLGELFPFRKARLSGRLITQIEFSIQPKLTYRSVSRTPADQPIVCVAVAQWPSGRTRVALGGYGRAPLLAMDGPEAAGAQAAADNAYSEAGDEWASAAYRQTVAAILTRRCLEE